MTVWPHQNEPALVKHADRRVTDGFDRKRHATLRKCACNRGYVGRAVAKAHQRKAAAVEIDDRAAFRKPGMGRPTAGDGVRVIVLDRRMCGRACFVPADRGGVIAIAERKTIGDELAGHARHDGIAHRAARVVALGRILKNRWRWLALAVALVAHVGVADVAAPDWLSFDLVAAEERRAAPAGECRG